ncbi:MAG: TonB-dependent receptor [Vicinamibacterales bacterium]
MTASRRVLCVVSLCAVTASPSVAAQSESRPPDGSGRVVITLSLESLRIPAVNVELVAAEGNAVLARTVSDGVGTAVIPDVPAGRYVVRAFRDGFAPTASAPFSVRAGTTEEVLMEMHLTFIRESVSVVAPANSPTQSIQPVAVSDVLTGARMDVQPLAGDDFQSLMTMLPSVVRGPEGRLRVKGGTPTTGAIQLSSASLNDPSTGDFDLELPSGAVESVEVLSNPFAAEYGRFSTSITQVTTKRGTNEWSINPDNLMPGFGSGFINKFEPRLSITGPLKRDRLLLGAYFQYRYLRTPVRSLPDQPDLGLDSFDSFTRLDAVLSPRHSMVGAVIYFPRKISNATMTTFRPPDSTPKFTQEGFAIGVIDRLILTGNTVLETTFSGRLFEVDLETKGNGPMVFAPQTQSGPYFNREERHVHSLQFVEAVSISRDDFAGQHVFKFGVDVQRSGFDGDHRSQTIEVRRLDGSLAERTVFSPSLTHPEVNGTEASLFAQDRWRLNARVMFELGFRVDRDGVADRVNLSPRAGMSFSVLPEGRGILRGGVGKFAQRTPLNIGAFESLPARTVSRFDRAERPLGSAVTYAHAVDELRTPESVVTTLAWDQRFGRRVFFKTAYLYRNGTHDAIVDPDADRRALVLSSSGRSKYWEFEATGRYLGSEYRDLTVSYVHSHGTRDLNDYDQFFGNFKNPLIRENVHSLNPTDVPNRIIIRGSQAVGGRWVLSPVFEWRTGFPWSAVDEYQDSVGVRNRSGRLPSVRTLDFTLVRPWQFKKYRFTAGLKVYNIFNSSAERDVQGNIASPDYGRFYNPIQRSIGIAVSSSRP